MLNISIDLKQIYNSVTFTNENTRYIGIPVDGKAIKEVTLKNGKTAVFLNIRAFECKKEDAVSSHILKQSLPLEILVDLKAQSIEQPILGNIKK